MDGLLKLSSTAFKQGLAKISQKIADIEDSKRDGEQPQIGKAMLKNYQQNWKEIRRRGQVCAEEAEPAEKRLEEANVQSIRMHNIIGTFQKELDAVQSTRVQTEAICDNIGRISSKVERLEEALNLLLDIQAQNEMYKADAKCKQRLVLQAEMNVNETRDVTFKLEKEKHRLLVQQKEEEVAALERGLKLKAKQYKMESSNQRKTQTEPKHAAAAALASGEHIAEAPAPSTIV